MISQVQIVNKFSKRILRDFPDVTYSRMRDKNCEAYYKFLNEDGLVVGAVSIEYESFKLSRDGIPLWEIFIGGFEVHRKFRGKGYGKEMIDWIEHNLPVYRIELCHRHPDDDDSASLNFWRHMGFHKPDKNYQTLIKVIKQIK